MIPLISFKASLHLCFMPILSISISVMSTSVKLEFMSYLAILGRQPELGLVELESVLGSEAVSRYGDHALLAQVCPLPRLGGTIKLARVISEQPAAAPEKLDWPI